MLYMFLVIGIKEKCNGDLLVADEYTYIEVQISKSEQIICGSNYKLYNKSTIPVTVEVQTEIQKSLEKPEEVLLNSNEGLKLEPKTKYSSIEDDDEIVILQLTNNVDDAVYDPVEYE